MRVLLIPSWYPDKKNELAGSFFREQANILCSHGYDIKVLYCNNESVSDWIFIKYLFAFFFKPKTVLSTSFLLQDPTAYSFVSKTNRKLSDRERFYILFKNYLRAYTSLLKTGWEPDIIHAQSSMEAGIVANYLSNKINKPFVIIEHQVFLLHQFSTKKKWLILKALEQANKVGVVSEHQKKMVLMQQPNCHPTVVWNYVNENVFTLKEQNKNSKFTILTITYPSYIKDYKTLFNAIQFLTKSCTDFQFIVIGNDSFNDLTKSNTTIFEEYCKELGIYEYGIFIPYLDREGISKILTTADVFVSTSIAETFGLAAREAMMCGVPVITTACGGIEDSISTETGIVVPIRDSTKLAQAILQVKNKEILYEPLAIRNYVIQQCGEQAFVNSMRNFYTI